MWWLILIIVLIFTYFKLRKNYKYWEERNVDYIKPWPIVGNLGGFMFGRITISHLLQEIYNTFPNKRYVGIFQFVTPTLYLNDIDLIKQITIKDFDHFVDRRLFAPEDVDPCFAKSLFQLRGQKWKDMRSALSPAFSGSKMRFMFSFIQEISESFVDYLSKTVKTEEPVTFELKNLYLRLTNDLIASTAFGVKCDSLNDEKNEFFQKGKRILLDGLVDMIKIFGYTLSPKIMSLCGIKVINDNVSKFFNDIICSSMKIREEQKIIRPDMVHLLMEARKGKLKDVGESKETQEKLNIDWSDEVLVAQAVLFFFAGFDTVSTNLSHLTYELTLHEDAQSKLQQEIDETLENCNGKLTYDVIMGMKYMDMVINESLRKWPPLPFVERQCVKPYVIKDEENPENSLYIPKDLYVWIPIYAIQRDPKNFEDPDRFDPERWSEENKNKIKPFSFMSFGIGPRICIGARLALLETKVIMFYLLSKFSLTPVKESQIPLKLRPSQLNLQAEKGFYVGLKARK